MIIQKKNSFLNFTLAILIGFFTLGIVATPSLAIPLGDLFGGASIQSGDLVFSNWWIDSNGGADLANIEVEPISATTLVPGGISYTALSDALSTTGGFIDIFFGYTVSIVSDDLIKGNSLELLDYLFTGGDEGGWLGIEEYVYDDLGDVGSKRVEADRYYDYYYLFDEIQFQPRENLNIENYLWVNADYVTDNVQLFEFEQRYSQTPEPGTMLLVGSGILGFAGLRRKLSKK